MDTETGETSRGHGPLVVIGAVVILVVGASLVGALSLSSGSSNATTAPAASSEAASSPATTATRAPSALADPDAVYDPVKAGEELPRGYRPLLARDQIEPVYEPVFISAGRVDWPADSLVIGVAGAEEAKAYPVTHLNSREMVIDSLEGIPILVTW